jgi:hypothetical protein
MHLYKRHGSMCSYATKGHCNRGYKCDFAHHPDQIIKNNIKNYKIIPCKSENCNRPNCTFGHYDADKKMRECPWWRNAFNIPQDPSFPYIENDSVPDSLHQFYIKIRNVPDALPLNGNQSKEPSKSIVSEPYSFVPLQLNNKEENVNNLEEGNVMNKEENVNNLEEGNVMNKEDVFSEEDMSSCNNVTAHNKEEMSNNLEEGNVMNKEDVFSEEDMSSCNNVTAHNKEEMSNNQRGRSLSCDQQKKLLPNNQRHRSLSRDALDAAEKSRLLLRDEIDAVPQPVLNATPQLPAASNATPQLPSGIITQLPDMLMIPLESNVTIINMLKDMTNRIANLQYDVANLHYNLANKHNQVINMESKIIELERNINNMKRQ